MLVWRIDRNTYNTASVRYRAAFPAFVLATQFGLRSRIISGVPTVASVPDEITALILNKAMRPADLPLIERAEARGARIIYDECNSLFALNNIQAIEQVKVARASASRLSALTTSSEALAQLFQSEGFTAPAAQCIPDMAVDMTFEVAALTVASPWVRRYPKRWWDRRHLRGWRDPAEHMAVAELPAKVLPRLLWFGAARYRTGTTSLGAFASLLAELNATARRTPFELLVLSNNRDAAASQFVGARFPWQYQDWSLLGAHQAIQSADAVILPVGEGEVSRYTSSNRQLMALAGGAPVITQPHRANDDLKDALFMVESQEHWSEAIHAALADKAQVRQKLEAARALIAQSYAPDIVGEQWRAAVQGS